MHKNSRTKDSDRCDVGRDLQNQGCWRTDNATKSKDATLFVIGHQPKAAPLFLDAPVLTLAIKSGIYDQTIRAQSIYLLYHCGGVLPNPILSCIQSCGSERATIVPVRPYGRVQARSKVLLPMHNTHRENQDL